VVIERIAVNNVTSPLCGHIVGGNSLIMVNGLARPTQTQPAPVAPGGTLRTAAPFAAFLRTRSTVAVGNGSKCC
jgi:hypothetical protein